MMWRVVLCVLLLTLAAVVGGPVQGVCLAAIVFVGAMQGFQLFDERHDW